MRTDDATGEMMIEFLRRLTQVTKRVSLLERLVFCGWGVCIFALFVVLLY